MYKDIKTVRLISGGGKVKGTIDIVPIKLSPEGVKTPGGRYPERIEVPEGTEMFFLTSPEKEGLYEQLGSEFDVYVRPASVHGSWKLRRNQAVVLRV